MDVLSSNEISEFRDAASAFLATRERLELMKVQVIELLGGPHGALQVPDEQVAQIMKLGKRLQTVLTEIMRHHSGLGGIRFRGCIFSLTMFKGQVLGIQILRETESETVNG